MPATEEQRQRAEANRVAALAKRKALTEQQQQKQNYTNPNTNNNHNPWRLFKCRKLSPPDPPAPAHYPKPPPLPHLTRPGSDGLVADPDSCTNWDDKFLVRLEICSPDSFSVTPAPDKGCVYPGDEECFKRLSALLLDVMPTHYTQIYGGGQACVYKLKDYDAVLSSLRNYRNIDVEKIPFGTLNVVRRLSHSFDTGRWQPCRPEHLTDEQVEELIEKLPRKLLDTLLPFQFDGLRFGLRRGGRCLVADEMGLGKTLQAIAIAGCFISEGSILVVCPAVLRFTWAEELERWLPSCLPSEIHLVFGHQDNPANLSKWPRVIVISYTMLHHLRNSMLKHEWALLIVDESHHLRCSKKKSEPEEIKAVLDAAAKIKRIVLLSGTPSLSRPFDIFHQINILWPGLLGQNKYDFAKTYCGIKFVQTFEGKIFQDFSRGVRLEELNVLLKQTVMIRRLKEHVLAQLPPKRRQIIALILQKSDITAAKAAIETVNVDASKDDAGEVGNSENSDKLHGKGKSKQLLDQVLGIAKLPGFREWFSIHPLISEQDSIKESDVKPNSQKMIIFAHHHKVLDGVQEFMCEKKVGFVRIDGNTLARDRQLAVSAFQSDNEVKIAIIGIMAGGVGLDFSAAQHVVFLELPQNPMLMLQAEDRAHRRGQTNAVNIYIFYAKDTTDESHWQYLNTAIHWVSSTTDGKYDSLSEIEVKHISGIETSVRHVRSLLALDEVSSSYSNFNGVALKNSKSPEAFYEAPRGFNSCAGSISYVDDPEYEGCQLRDGQTDNSLVANSKLRSHNSDNETETNLRLDQGTDHPEKKIQKEEKLDDHNPAQPAEVDECSSIVLNSLRFEVSKYTRRIHLYSCIPGTDSRPQPLYENFLPEELESICSPVDGANNNNEAVSKHLTGNPAYKQALLAFANEWTKLRPIERRKLTGKALQLPLSVELCCLNEGSNHDNGGILKGGSRRRITPWNEICHPLPSNAVWKKVNLSNGHRKKENEYSQGWTLADEPLCKLCQKPCMGNNAKTPEYFEDLFCSLSCCEEYRIRTSNKSLRQELFQVEHGVCTNCHLDCHKLVKTTRPLSLERRKEYIEKVAPKVAARKKLLDKLINDPSEGNAWHADHIVPVYRGGGECRLENMRTLCVACHSDVTAAQNVERRKARANARKQLAVLLQDVHDQKGKAKIDESIGEDDELLVKVPGSSYTVGKEPDLVGPGSENPKTSVKAEDSLAYLKLSS